jgi:ABC-type transporter Mla MlaB component
MDRKLNALVKLDVTADVVRIDVRGSLSQETLPALVYVVRRIRRMGITSHVRVDLSQAAFVESSALAGLRNDLNAIDGGGTAGGVSTGSGVSLEFTPRRDGSAAEAGTMLQSVGFTGEFAASIDPTGSRPLAGYSDDELLAASDSVFGMLDDPDARAGTELLAQYDAIGREISRRESDGPGQMAAAESLSCSPTEPVI